MSNGPASNTPTIKPTDLRGILKYIPRFQGQIFVLAIDGSIVDDENFSNLLVDIAVLRSLGIKVILVHGIGRQIKQLATTRNVAITDAHGSGPTDKVTLDLAVEASARVSHIILEGLTQNNLKCAITNAVRALPVGIIKGVDQFHTAKVDRIDKEFITRLVEQQVVPIIQPIGYGPEGQSLRINSDLLATEVAEAVGASKIIYLTPHPGLMINGAVRRDIAVDTLRELLQTHPTDIAEVNRSKAAHAVRAIDQGTPRVHIVDGRIFDGLINEIFSSEGVGTLIFGNDYQQIRKATKRDVRTIYNLTRNAVRREELLHRTLQTIEKHIDQFYVFEIDENIIATVSLYFYPDQPQVAEVGSLFVMPYYHGRGVGRKMVDFACYQAKQRGIQQIIALSTQSYSFFTSKLGFEEVPFTLLPEARRKAFQDSGRNPKVMLKSL